MIQDKQILATLKFCLTKLKSIIPNQWLQKQYIFAINNKFDIAISFFYINRADNVKKYLLHYF